MVEMVHLALLSVPAPLIPVDSGVTALDPALLAPMADAAVTALLREGEASNTVASYRSALRYWAAWFALRYRAPITLPVSPATVLQFVVDHVQRSSDDGLVHELPTAVDAALISQGFKGKLGPLALATVGHRIAVLSKVHGLQGQPNPCRDEAVRILLAKTRRAYAKRGAPTQRKAALTREPLDALLATCDESLRGLRDRAILLFAWSSGGRRRSEVVGATLENTRRVADREWVYCLPHDKTNQAGQIDPRMTNRLSGPQLMHSTLGLPRVASDQGTSLGASEKAPPSASHSPHPQFEILSWSAVDTPG